MLTGDTFVVFYFFNAYPVFKAYEIKTVGKVLCTVYCLILASWKHKVQFLYGWSSQFLRVLDNGYKQSQEIQRQLDTKSWADL